MAEQGRTRHRWTRNVVATSAGLALMLVTQAAWAPAAAPARVPSGESSSSSSSSSTDPTSSVDDSSTTSSSSTSSSTTSSSTTTSSTTTTLPPPPTCDGVRTTPALEPSDPRVQIVSDRSTSRFQAVGKKSGVPTRDIQRRLLELGFWLSGTDGSYGTTTSQAVMAFQKYVGLPRTGTVDQATADALSCARYRAFSNISQPWTLVEVDKGRQLLFLVNNGRTVSVLNTSTGNGKPYRERNKKDPRKWEVGVAITPNGWHKVYYEWSDGWKPGDLGRIYRPKYVKGGIAIHGMTSVPGYPASHGCIRLSLPAMDMVWKLGWVKRGTSVWVHD